MSAGATHRLTITPYHQSAPGTAAALTALTVWTSTDGVLSGGVMVNGKERTYDLAKWAKKHVGPRDEDEEEVDFWNEVESDFLSEYA